MGENLQKNLSSTAVVLINCLFVYKYTWRLSAAMALGLTLLVAVASLFFLYRFLLSNRPCVSGRTALWMGLTYLVLLSLLLLCVDSKTLIIDRWEMIRLFWHSVESGAYPYAACSPVSGNHPGGMPLYFLLAYPFYLWGEVGLMTLCLLLALLLYFFFTAPSGCANGVVWTLSMAFVGYEVVARSTILVNACLWALYLWLLLHKNDFSNRSLWLAVLGGLLLSTRVVFVLVLVVYGVWQLKQGVRVWPLVRWSALLLLSFVSTFLPLIAQWGLSAFEAMNPFLIQSIFLPTWVLVGMVASSSLLGWFSRTKGDVLFYAGSVLFAVIAFYLLFVGVENGFDSAILASGADITYFLFAVPFFVLRAMSTTDLPTYRYNCQ